MIEAVLKNLTDPEWWADQILSYALFSLIAGLIAGWFANLLRKRAERLEREPYEGWTRITRGFGDRPQAIYWEDMKRFLTSDVELWRWIKSVCSTTCTLTSRTAETAMEHGWLVIDRDARKVIIDYERMPAEDARWQIDPPWVKGGGSGSPTAEDTARAPL